jgi:zeaxanthin glucosyltransferase
MAHFGIISPPVAGHLHPFGALGRELISRGHRVSCLHMADVGERARSEGLEFIEIGQEDHPPGSLQKSLSALGKLHGHAALRFTIGAVARTSLMVCRDAPAAVRAAGIDALLVDQMEPAGGAVAEHLGVPFITVCNALALNAEPTVPPPFTAWTYRDSWWASTRNRIGYTASRLATRPIRRTVGAFRKRWGLSRLPNDDASYSPRAQICQMPREFDFPRRQLPACFHYVGPLRDAVAEQVAFPWDKLNGRPLVYASLGTLQNSREPVFRCFAEACAGLDVQLVLSHGGGLNEDQAMTLPGNPVVVGYAPQRALMARAALTISHAGLNTVLDSLASGVPLVTVPITYEQPAIARRIQYSGVGRVIPLSRLRRDVLAGLVREVSQGREFKEAAGRFKANIARAGGARRAAEIIEAALHRPFVIRHADL